MILSLAKWIKEISKKNSREVAIGVSLLAAIIYMAYSMSYSLPFPQYDDYSNILGWANQYARASGISEIFSVFTLPQAEHQQMLLKLMLAAQMFLLGHVDLEFLVNAGNLSWCIGAFFLMAIGYRFGVNFWMLIPVAILFLKPQTYDSISFASGMINLLYIALIIASFYFISKPGNKNLIISLALVVSSALTVTAGFLAFPALLVTLFFMRQCGTRLWRDLGVVAATMLVTVLIYFLSPHRSSDAYLALFHTPLHLLAYFVLFIGSAIGNLTFSGGYLLGILLLCFWGLLPLLRPKSVNPIHMGLAVFCFLVAASAALFRNDLGLGQATSSRYASISTILIVLTYYAALRLVPKSLNRNIGLGMATAAFMFCIISYTVYTPVISSQWNVTIWNSRAFFDGGDLVELDRMSESFNRGVLNQAGLAGRMAAAQPVIFLPVRGWPSGLAMNTGAMMLGGLDSLSMAPGLVKFQGFAGIPSHDLLWAKRWIVLENQDDVYLVPATPMFRVLGNEPLLSWSGFVSLIRPGDLPAGTYAIGVHVALGSKQQTMPFLGRLLHVGRAADIGRTWKTCSGEIIEIEPSADGSSITFRETGDLRTAKVSFEDITVDLSGRHGRFNSDRDQISWEDGDMWLCVTRKFDKDPAYQAASQLLGRWQMGGRLCRIDFRFLIEGLTVVNENGERQQAHMEDGRIVVPTWKILGTISQDGSRIEWSNNTAWQREVPPSR